MKKKSLNIIMFGLLVPALMGLFAQAAGASPDGVFLPDSGLELPPGTTFGKDLPPEDRRLIALLWQILKQEAEDDIRSKLKTAKERVKVLLRASEVTEPLKDALSDQFFLELCQKGTLRRIQNAINAGANVNAKTSNAWRGREAAGWTPLMIAAIYNAHPDEVVTLLIYNGADVNANTVPGMGMTPLIAAVGRITNLDVIMALIKNGADVNASSGGALFEAAARNSNPEIITALIQNGAYINAKDVNGMTALMHAAQYNRNPEVITRLIKHGADVNLKIGPHTALMFAAGDNDNPEVLTALLKNGADFEAAGGMWNVLFAAMNPHAHSSYDRIRKPEVTVALITALAKNGLDTNLRHYGQTALMAEVKEGDGRWGNTRIEVLEALLSHGADVNASDNSGRTALMSAAVSTPENLEVVTWLLKNGADAKMKDKQGQTALDYAENSRNYSILKLLENHGR